jgi:hypothetical protein
LIVLNGHEKSIIPEASLRQNFRGKLEQNVFKSGGEKSRSYPLKIQMTETKVKGPCQKNSLLLAHSVFTVPGRASSSSSATINRSAPDVMGRAMCYFTARLNGNKAENILMRPPPQISWYFFIIVSISPLPAQAMQFGAVQDAILNFLRNICDWMLEKCSHLIWVKGWFVLGTLMIRIYWLRIVLTSMVMLSFHLLGIIRGGTGGF